MDTTTVVVLILIIAQEALSDNYRNSSFDDGLPSRDLIIYTTGGPVPDYLLNSPYKIVPLSNRSFSRRADDPSATVEFSNKDSQNSTIVEDFARDTSLRYKDTAQTSIRQLSKQRKQKNRNRSRSRNFERYNQRVESSESDVITPIKKGQVPSNSQERNVAIPDQTNGPVYITDVNKLSSTPSYLYLDRNAINAEQLKGPDYINSANKLTTASSNLYRDRNEVTSDQSNGPVYINDVRKLTTVPTFQLSSENFPTPIAYSPLSPIYTTNPSFLAPKIPPPSTKLSKFPRPAVKGYEIAAYDFGPLYKPYSFGYDVFDGFGTKQYRQESATGDGVVRGNYGYKDYQGIYRQVEYTADENGFHAVLKSNEPGLANVDTADVSVSVEPPPVWPPSEN